MGADRLRREGSVIQRLISQGCMGSSVIPKSRASSFVISEPVSAVSTIFRTVHFSSLRLRICLEDQWKPVLRVVPQENGGSQPAAGTPHFISILFFGKRLQSGILCGKITCGKYGRTGVLLYADFSLEGCSAGQLYEWPCSFPGCRIAFF